MKHDDTITFDVSSGGANLIPASLSVYAGGFQMASLGSGSGEPDIKLASLSVYIGGFDIGSPGCCGGGGVNAQSEMELKAPLLPCLLRDRPRQC